MDCKYNNNKKCQSAGLHVSFKSQFASSESSQACFLRLTASSDADNSDILGLNCSLDLSRMTKDVVNSVPDSCLFPPPAPSSGPCMPTSVAMCPP